jgi:site-specific DNA recombinase
MKLDAYRRVSRVNGRNGDSFISPEQQRDKIEQWAKLRGVKIARWHEPDLDQSGGKLSRPNFDKALDRVRSGKSDGIVVAKLDRFSRAGVADALKLIESIVEAGGQVASVEEGIDPTTATGEFTMTVFLALARMQRRQIGANWKDAQRRAVERGVHVASRAPTGYVRDDAGRLVAHPDYGPHIAEVFRMKADGASWRDLAHYLRAHQVASPYGTTNWVPRALSHVIENRAYLGEARSGAFVKPGAHEALVDEDTWRRAQEAKGTRPVNSTGGALLSGILRCAGCGYVIKPDHMKGRDGGKLRLYRCRTERSSGRCPAPASTLGRVIEPYVEQAFMAHVAGLRAKGTVTDTDLSAAEAAVEAADHELRSYLEGVEAAGLEPGVWAQGASNRREALEAAREAFDRARDRSGLAELPDAVHLAAIWPELSVSERRKLLRSAIDTVILHKGRTPIEERAEITWKGEQLPDGYDWAGGAITVDFEAVARRMRETGKAVAPVYERILRERHPGTSWEAS